MLKIVAPLEIVTPLFMGGSDPGGRPELRPASLRGGFRFWLRTLLGAHIGDSRLDELRKAETAVFGDAGQDSGSPVIVRLAGRPQPARFAMAPEAGLRYLFFSMGQRVRDPRTGRSITTWRDCFPAGSRFDVILQRRSPSPGQEQDLALIRAAAAFWLLVRLGGVGARSRRGAGSLHATAEPANWPERLPPLGVRANTPRDLQAEMGSDLRVLRQATALPASERVQLPSAFDVLHPDSCRIHILDRTWPTWQGVLESVGTAFQAFRNRYQPDYSNVKENIGGRAQRLEPVQRAAFGLPIVFYFRSLGGASGTLQGSDHDRRSSPLFFKVVRLDGGQYAVMLIVFHAALLDRRERLKLKMRGRSAFTAPPTHDAIADFLEAVSSHGNYYVAPLLEVDYR